MKIIKVLTLFLSKDMFIWRIENRDGKGPYMTDRVNGLGLTGEEHHPGPMGDVPEFYRTRNYNLYFFGFKSLSDLRNWFHPTAISRLYKDGFKIVKYKVEKKYVLKGGKQVAFLKNKATMVTVHEKCKRFVVYTN